MTEEERTAVRIKLTALGITVVPAGGIGGFQVLGLKNVDFLWLPTEHAAWAHAYGYYNAWKDEYPTQ